MRILLFAILFVLCWPAALLLLLLYPLIWLVTLPFRIVGLSFDLVFALLRLPIRALRAV